MNFKKFFLLIVALAVFGGVVFSQPAIAVSPAISFIIGVILSATAFSFFCSTTLKDNASTKTLYVGNLPYRANEANVRQLFSEHGEVFSVRLMKDKRTGKRRGFGFVVMASSDIEATISALNNKDYMQRALKVRVATDPKHPDSESSQ